MNVERPVSIFNIDVLIVRAFEERHKLSQVSVQLRGASVYVEQRLLVVDELAPDHECVIDADGAQNIYSYREFFGRQHPPEVVMHHLQATLGEVYQRARWVLRYGEWALGRLVGVRSFENPILKVPVRGGP